jgi:hypothetical protein
MRSGYVRDITSADLDAGRPNVADYETEMRIKKYIRPRFNAEMKRLGLPKETVVRIRPHYFPFDPFEDVGAEIVMYPSLGKRGIGYADMRMGGDSLTGWGTLWRFYHEMKHLQIADRRGWQSEVVSDIHAFRMVFQEIAKLPFEKVREISGKAITKARGSYDLKISGESLEILQKLSEEKCKSKKDVLVDAMRVYSHLMELTCEPGIVVVDLNKRRKYHTYLV